MKYFAKIFSLGAPDWLHRLALISNANNSKERKHKKNQLIIKLMKPSNLLTFLILD